MSDSMVLIYNSLPANCPAYSVLDVSGTEQMLGRQFLYWRESLKSKLLEMK